jgi:glycosyltransferase involved in cell wall biosynthesis
MLGEGIARNRNLALQHAQGELLLIADDDCRYQPAYFERIIEAFQAYPEADIITFKAINEKKVSQHFYADHTMRRSAKLPRFDERFGLGAPFLGCGEEEVFVHEAWRNGLQVRFVPQVVVETTEIHTGVRFLTNQAVQRAKGAVLYRMHGRLGATLRCLKAAALLPCSAPRWAILKEMLSGIRYMADAKE